MRHYAGPVVYTVDGFVERNRDQLSQEATQLLHGSSCEMVRECWPEGGPGGGASPAGKPKSGAGGNGGALKGPRPGHGRGRKSSNIVAVTIAGQFKFQLRTLLDTLRATTPHYVRCIKPNDQAKPDCFDRHRVVEQLSCGGVLEAVRVARAGYPTRLLLGQFLSRYFLLKPGVCPYRVSQAARDDEKLLHTLSRRLLYEFFAQYSDLLGADEGAASAASADADAAAAAAAAAEAAGRGEPDPDGVDPREFARMCRCAGVQVGLSKVFFRKGAYELLENQRSLMITRAAVRCQSYLRACFIRRQFRQLRARAVLAQCQARRHLARGALVARRAARAAEGVQRMWRRRRVRRRREAGWLLCRCLRGFFGGRSALLRQRRAAVTLQSAHRCRTARSEKRELVRKMRDVKGLQDEIVALKRQLAEQQKAQEAEAA